MGISPVPFAPEGYVTDSSRDQLPKWALWRCKDYIPRNGAPLRKRGGWTFSTSALNGSYISGLGWMHKGGASDEHLVAITNLGQVYAIRNGVGAGVGGVGGNALKSNPFFYDDVLMIFDPDGDSYAYDGSSVSSAINDYRVGTAWGDFIIVGNKEDSENQIAFGDSHTNLISSATWDFPVLGDVVAIVGFPHMVIVFGSTQAQALIGDIPPPGGDMSERTIFQGVGCLDARSLVSHSSGAIWAHSSGIYRFDGSQLQDLTKQSGNSNEWQELVRDFSLDDGWIAAGGTGLGYYWISVHNGDGELQKTALIQLDSSRQIEFTNLGAACYVQRPGGQSAGAEELFFGRRSDARVGSLSSCWFPSSSNSQDGDATPVLPVFETPFYTSPGESRFRRAFLSYDLRRVNGEPSILVSSCESPESTATYEQSSDTLYKTTTQKRDQAGIRRRGLGVGLKIAQTGESDDTSIYGLAIDSHPLGGSR